MSPKVIFACVFALFAISCTSAAPDRSRIVGGDFAEPAQFPYQVYLKLHGLFSCGGSIYNEKYVITASHCVVDYDNIPEPPSSIVVVAGTNSLVRGGVKKAVKTVIPHEIYNGFDYKNDIALLELEEPFVFTKAISPIKVYDGELVSGQSTVISGWGRVYHGGPVSNDLKYNNLTIITQPECGHQIGHSYDGIVCIDHKSDNGACHGDSGGPATVDGKLVGVANFIKRRCGTDKPDGYALVPYFIDWIKENTNTA